MVSTAEVVFSWTICRCSQLRTLVIMLDKMQNWVGVSDLCELNNLIAGLPALATGAPGLRALQVVLPMLDGMYEPMHIHLDPLWRGLGAQSSLTSLALGWVFMPEEFPAHEGERIAHVLDAAQVRSAVLYMRLCDMCSISRIPALSLLGEASSASANPAEAEVRCAPASHHLHPVMSLCCSRLV